MGTNLKLALFIRPDQVFLATKGSKWTPLEGNLFIHRCFICVADREEPREEGEGYHIF